MATNRKQIMKNLMIPMLAGLVLSCTNSKAQDNKFTDKIHKEFTVSPQSMLGVYNLNGSIKVVGYDGNKVIMDVDETIDAKNAKELASAKSEIKLGFEQVGDSLLFYIAEPYDTRPRRKNWNWGNNRERKIEYEVHLNYVIKVPNSMRIAVSTVNEGEILVENMHGAIKANHVNGKITIKDAVEVEDVHTINGDVNINFVQNPTKYGKFYSLNGKLNITMPKNFSADCEFKTFQGDFYTDFENTEKLPAKVEKVTKENDNGTKTHKIIKRDMIRFGKGGNNLFFETFNGNVYIKESK